MVTEMKKCTCGECNKDWASCADEKRQWLKENGRLKIIVARLEILKELDQYIHKDRVLFGFAREMKKAGLYSPKTANQDVVFSIAKNVKFIQSLGTCRSDRDGECSWKECPQKKKYKSGCPLVDWNGD